MGIEFKLLFTNNIKPLGNAKKNILEVINDKSPSSSEIKKAIDGGMKAVDLVMDNVDSIIKPASTVFGIASFIALTLGVVRKFSGVDENEYDSGGYWEMATAGLCGGLHLYLSNRAKSLMRYVDNMERLIKDAAEVGRDIKIWEMKKNEGAEYAKLVQQQAEAEKANQLDFFKQAQEIASTNAANMYKSDIDYLKGKNEKLFKANEKLAEAIKNSDKVINAMREESLNLQNNYDLLVNALKAANIDVNAFMQNMSANNNQAGLGAATPNLGGTVINP